jgi:phosphotransacetylase
VLIQHKTAGFIITGGQDNVQGVAGQMLTFFSELGFHMPQFPFIAHSRGWTAEDMERNVTQVRESRDLQRGAEELAERAVTLATTLLEHGDADHVCRGGRKAQRLDSEG